MTHRLSSITGEAGFVEGRGALGAPERRARVLHGAGELQAPGKAGLWGLAPLSGRLRPRPLRWTRQQGRYLSAPGLLPSWLLGEFSFQLYSWQPLSDIFIGSDVMTVR